MFERLDRYKVALDAARPFEGANLGSSGTTTRSV